MLSQLIKDLTNQITDLEAIYLFGSRAEKENAHSRDWDLAFLSRSGLPAMKLWELRSELEVKYDMTLDLIDFYKSPTVFQFEIIKKGKIVWCMDLDDAHYTEALIISFYQKLNQERKEILDGIKQRGRIYG